MVDIPAVATKPNGAHASSAYPSSIANARHRGRCTQPRLGWSAKPTRAALTPVHFSSLCLHYERHLLTRTNNRYLQMRHEVKVRVDVERFVSLVLRAQQTANDWVP